MLGILLAAALLSISVSPVADQTRVKSLGDSGDVIRGLVDLRLPLSGTVHGLSVQAQSSREASPGDGDNDSLQFER